MDFKQLFKIECFKNGKQPKKGSKFKKPNEKDNFKGVSVVKLLKQNNVGILTGEINNLYCVDFDTHKPDFKFDYKNHTIEELTKMTYSQKTQSGGIHCVFQYDEDLQQNKQNIKTNEICEVDTRSNNGYFLVSGSKIFDKSYNVINNIKPIKMPQQLKDFLLNNGYGKNENNLTKINSTNTKKIIDNKIEDKNFNIIDRHLLFILNSHKNIFNNIEFWKYTSIMKYLNKKKIWDTFNKTQPKYNEKNNNIIWDKVDPNKCNLSLLFPTFFKTTKDKKDLNSDDLVLKNKCETLSSYFKMKHLNNDKIRRFTLIDKQKLGYSFFKEDYNYLVKSDTGTGKTTSIKHFLKAEETNEKYEHFKEPNKKFISIVSRRSLGLEQHTIFNEFGLECKYYEYEPYFTNDDNIIVQIDSINKLTRSIDFSEYYVILDEFESILKHLFTSDTLKNRRCSVMKLFIDLLKNCKNFFGIDADISNKSVHFITEFINREYKIYNNKYKHNKDVEAIEYINQNEIIEKMYKSEKFIVCCDSKTISEKLKKTLEEKYNVRNILLITSDTDEYYRFDDYDKIIFSPKIIYGIDSTIERDVFCWYKGTTITPEKMIQQVSRCRNIKKIHFHFMNKKYNPINETFEDILNINHKSVKHGLNKDGDNILCNEFKYDNELEDKYLFLYSKFEYDELCFNTNKFGHFIKLLNDRGVNITTDILYNLNKQENKLELNNPDELEYYDYFSIEQNKRILDFIGLNIEEAKPHYDLIKSYDFFQRHYNIKKFFFEKGSGLNDTDYKNKVDSNDDFIINNIKLGNQKLRFLKRTMEIVGNKNRILINSSIIPNEREQEKLLEEFKIIFGKKSFRDFNLKDKSNINKSIKKLYDLIFGKILNKGDRKMINNETFRIYDINNEILENHRNLFNSKINKKMKHEIENVINDGCFIDIDEDDDDYNNPLDYGICK
tara:strand:- start:800 stop:3637 length:2838 start_codon:yes stop_codon:yes gene_type:complete